MANIRDVALEAGVSPTTVSRTFREPGSLTEKTEKRVLKAAEMLGYRPRPATPPPAGLPKRERSNAANTHPFARAIGFQFLVDSPDVVLASNVFYAPMFAGVQAEATALGLHLLVHTTDVHTLHQELPRMVSEKIIKGMLLVGTANREHLDCFTGSVSEIILVDNRDETGTYESIVSDGFGGARAATLHLIQTGHRRIGFFVTRKNVPTFDDRLRGYWCALLESGIVPDPALVIQPEGCHEDWGNHGITERFRAQVENGSQSMTALLAANDDCALQAQKIARQLGLQLPEDLSMIGFDDVPAAAHADPPLTTVRVDKEAMGRLAVRRLWARLTSEAQGQVYPLPPAQHVQPVTLVHRDSCRPLSAA